MEPQMDYIEELMIARLNGTIAQKDLDFLDEMIASDTQVAELWRQHQLIHSQLKGNYDVDAAWKKVEAGIDQATQRPARRKPWLAIVGVLLIAAVGIVYYLLPANHDIVSTSPAKNLTAGNTIMFSTQAEKVPVDQKTVRTAHADIVDESGTLVFKAKAGDNVISTLEVPQGLDRRIRLSDSTMVWVNAATKISFPLNFTGATRDVTLEGEAYFEVAKIKARPFIVHTAAMDVEVKGTHFNLKAYPDEPAQASLTEGSVAAKHGAQTLLLVPGKAAALAGDQLIERSFDETMVLAWMKGAYFLDNETLGSISHTVERWFGYSFSYSDPSIGQIHFSGALEKSASLETFLARLCAAANLGYTINGTKVTLNRK